MAESSVEKLTIVLPLPPRILSPNCPIGSLRGRFMRAAASRKYRTQARDAVLAQQVSGWTSADVCATFFHKIKRRRDDVNHLSMLKAAYDGCVEAGLLPDDDRDHLRTTGCQFEIDKKNPRVELTFTRML